jgi:hypothetical protein
MGHKLLGKVGHIVVVIFSKTTESFFGIQFKIKLVFRAFIAEYETVTGRLVSRLQAVVVESSSRATEA